MIKVITATNNLNLNEELKKEKNVQVLYKDIFYKEGILEILEKDIEVDYIIIDENLSGEIELNNLIEKILEKNKNIKIIITIKKENKNKININNKKIIKILYEGKINLKKIKNYNKNFEEIKIKKNNNNYEKTKIKNNNKKLKKINIKNKYNIKNKIYNFQNIKEKYNIESKKKNVNSKIISIFGERQVGKSIFIINLAYYLKSKNCKILLVELNEENSSIFSILGCKKFNKKSWKIKKRIKNNYKKVIKKYLPKYVNQKILENMIISIDKNMDLLSYNKLINFNFIKTIQNNYDYFIIENYFKKNNKINKKIMNNSDKNILIITPNLLGIKNSKKIIEKNKLNKKNNLKIIINNFNKYSIDEKIIKNIFGRFKIIGKIKHKNIYDDLINKNFKNIKYKYLIKDFGKIGEDL